MVYKAMGGLSLVSVSDAEFAVLWPRLKGKTPLSSDMSQSSGLFHKEYLLDGVQYNAVWERENNTDVPSWIDRHEPLEQPDVRQARLESERLKTKVNIIGIASGLEAL